MNILSETTTLPHKEIHITVNGEPQVFAQQDMSLASWLNSDAITARPPFAVAVNQVFISAENYKQYVLKSGDSIEIVAPMQGG